eukprot:52792-Amphidinium_carterae.1
MCDISSQASKEESNLGSSISACPHKLLFGTWGAIGEQITAKHFGGMSIPHTVTGKECDLNSASSHCNCCTTLTLMRPVLPSHIEPPPSSARCLTAYLLGQPPDMARKG